VSEDGATAMGPVEFKVALGALPPDRSPVYQRSRTDCLRSCVAVALGLSAEEVSDAPASSSESLQWPDWAAKRGLTMLRTTRLTPPYPEWWIAGVLLRDEAGRPIRDEAGRPATHAVVMHRDTLVHDPDPMQAIARLGGTISLVDGLTFVPATAPAEPMTEVLDHAGTYRAWARVRTSSPTPPQLRLVWDVADLTLPEENDPVAIPAPNSFYLVDLGEVRLDRPAVGAHRWQGQIQAKGAAGGENVEIDELYLVNADEFYAAAAAPGVLSDGFSGLPGRDEFNQTAGALNGKTAARGGNWATSGVATDFQCSGSANFNVTRTGAVSEAGYRRALLAAGLGGDVAVQADITLGIDSALVRQSIRLLARATAASDSSDVTAQIDTLSPGLIANIEIARAGTPVGYVPVGPLATLLGGLTTGPKSATIAFCVFAASQTWAFFGGAVGSSLQLLGAGALGAAPPAGTGAGFAHSRGSGAGGQLLAIDNFKTWVPPADAVAFPGRSAQLTTEGLLRQDASGVAYGPISDPIGDIPRIPVSGLEGRPVEVFLRPSRGDLDQVPDAGLDPVTGQIFYRPSWLFANG
jgi:hypothetical protein